MLGRLTDIRGITFHLFVLLLVFGISPAVAQPVAGQAAPAAAEETPAESDDASIQARIGAIFALLGPLSAIEVEVQEGVVLLSGSVPNDPQADRAINLAGQIPGVLTVDDGIERRLDVQGNLTPLLEQIQADIKQWIHALPLIFVALLVFIIIVYAGYSLARWSALWHRVTPNPFLNDLVAQAVRVASVLLGLVITLNLLGATALIATILGGAGVAGLAIGFAVRDTMENYISSIMLSLRQPFRADDHVVINEHEGKVVRLTSRATVLMTLDGNQLRIPNSTVFKAVILNYSRNPQRRFQFELGVDANDDPLAAIGIGVSTMAGLSFVLADPAPNAIIVSVGDSNIVLRFLGWIDQEKADFGKARSLAISATKNVLEEQGFTMPEPIYRLRIDPTSALPATLAVSPETPHSLQPDPPESSPHSPPASPAVISKMDVKPDNSLQEIVDEERALDGEENLLSENRPVE